MQGETERHRGIKSEKQGGRMKQRYTGGNIWIQGCRERQGG